MSEVEIEFALDPLPGTGGMEASLELLQVRPVSDMSSFQEGQSGTGALSLTHKLVFSPEALGNGVFGESDRIVAILPGVFDKMKTEEMAEEISAINSRLNSLNKSYFLIGPGRWGSSIPTLGVPVSWTDISAARMVVEYGMDGFRIEPSQGTHFFQNITSLGVGYLSVDEYAGAGKIDFEALDSLELEYEGKFAKVYKVEGLTGFIDRNTGEAVIGY